MVAERWQCSSRKAEKPLNEFDRLLEQAGHRPAKSGLRWFCATCPAGKGPALSVDSGREVYFCHRCGRGGSIGTLKKELGIKEGRHWTQDERRTYAERKELVERKANRFFEFLKELRRSKVEAFRSAYDRELTARDAGRAALERGQPVSGDLLQAAASFESEELAQDLDAIDDPDNLPIWIVLWEEKVEANRPDQKPDASGRIQA